MAFTRGVLTAGGILSAGLMLCWGNWVRQRSMQVPLGHRGSLVKRTTEVTQAVFRTKDIRDEYTAKNHVDTVVMLPSKESIKIEALKRELERIAASAGAGYLKRALQDTPPTSPPTFEYMGKQQSLFFSGPLSGLNNVTSREDILKGHYCRCPSLVSVESSGEGANRYKLTDVVITGTTERKACHELQIAILRDTAMIAAGALVGSTIDPKDPISDMAVFDRANDSVQEVGDLTTMADPIKKKLFHGPFTACTYFFPQKTRLSGDNQKPIGAVIIGIPQNEDVCLALTLKRLAEVLERSKSER